MSYLIVLVGFVHFYVVFDSHVRFLTCEKQARLRDGVVIHFSSLHICNLNEFRILYLHRRLLLLVLE